MSVDQYILSEANPTHTGRIGEPHVGAFTSSEYAFHRRIELFTTRKPIKFKVAIACPRGGIELWLVPRPEINKQALLRSVGRSEWL